MTREELVSLVDFRYRTELEAPDILRAAELPVDSLLRSAQVPAEWFKAICGGITLMALIISRYAGGESPTGALVIIRP